MADVEPTEYNKARADITRSIETKMCYDYTYDENLSTWSRKAIE